MVFTFPSANLGRTPGVGSKGKAALTHHVIFEIGNFGSPYWNVESLVQCFKIIVKRASSLHPPSLFLQTLLVLLVRKSRRENKEFREEKQTL